MKEIRISVAEGIRWDLDFTKSLHEALPYHVQSFVSAQFDENGVTITTEETEVSSEQIQNAVNDLIERLAKSFRKIAPKSVRTMKATSTPSKDDPFDNLVQSGAVKQTGHGKFVYSGEFVEVFTALDKAIEEFAISLGAKPEIYPTTVQTDTLLKSGYLELHPQFAFFVAPLHMDHQSLAAISSLGSLDAQPREETVAHLGMPDQILAPTVCYHTFEARRDCEQKSGVITALNKCHRHEPVDVASLARLTTYWMREIVVFGSPEKVSDVIGKTRQWSCEFLEDLGLGYELVSASDPFFADRGASNRLMQAALDLKQELIMPLFGGRKTAVASFNNHQNSLVGKFGIQAEEAHDEKLVSGCIGWGYERLIYAMFSGLGESVEQWPEAAKKKLGL